MSIAKPDYGIDAPGIIRILVLIGIVLFILAPFLPAVAVGPVTFALRSSAIWTATACLLEALTMMFYSKVGKFRHRDRMLARVKWSGHEQVLDVGTGRGLLLIGAAKKLTSGRAVGIDIWSKKDLSGNSLKKTLRNLEIEGVSGLTDVVSGDAADMQFPDESFDVVLSNLCIHNIPSREGRERACREIVRVLRPGGKALVSDFMNTAHYVKAFQAVGAKASRGRAHFLHILPSLRIVEAVKAAAP